MTCWRRDDGNLCCIGGRSAIRAGDTRESSTARKCEAGSSGKGGRSGDRTTTRYVHFSPFSKVNLMGGGKHRPGKKGSAI